MCNRVHIFARFSVLSESFSFIFVQKCLRQLCLDAFLKCSEGSWADSQEVEADGEVEHVHEHPGFELLAVAPDDYEHVGVDQRLEANHHQGHWYEIHEPYQELPVAARHESYARNVHDYQDFSAQLQVFQFMTAADFLVGQERERAEKLVKALGQAVASDEKVVNVYADHHYLQEIQPHALFVQIFVNPVPPDGILLAGSKSSEFQCRRQNLGTNEVHIRCGIGTGPSHCYGSTIKKEWGSHNNLQ